ncbi:hypothetical protein LJK88_28220 [Paenibacillus sp. P26]|nr:hypothetical protein LJK88_28220 [Paenibacillus sp. P26]
MDEGRSDSYRMRWYFKALGTRKIIEFVLLIIFVLFFLGPLLNLAVLAFSGQWNYPDLLPHTWSLKWWKFVLQQEDIAKSIGLSFIIASIVTALAIVLCIPAKLMLLPGSAFRSAGSFCFPFCLPMLFRKWGSTFRSRCCSLSSD